MGNSTSSARGHHDDTVDFGFLSPQGVYSGSQDWNQDVVVQLIVQRKLAPFYRPLEDYEESWDDEQILAARRELPDNEHSHSDAPSSRPETTTARAHNKRPSAQKEIGRYPEAALYRGAVECPICFLYYPANINHSRCCDQAICTECFVQIKRSEPTTTHLVSDPAACPYCVQENFGVVYTHPSWRAGIGSEGSTPPSWPDSPKSSVPSLDASLVGARRRRSFGPDSPEVVTIDQIRPDWEAKLATVRAAAQRRANRRIIMRQVGDRLIPVGVTSGRMHGLPTEEMDNAEANGGGSGTRRSRRRQQNPDIQQILGQVGMAGQDLEEMMIMEAMRLSLIDHEDQQRRQRDEEIRNQQNSRNSNTGRRSNEEPVISSPQSLSSFSFSGASAPASPNTALSISSQGVDDRASHRSSASLSASPPDTLWRHRRSSPPPFSIIGAAVNSASSAASAVLRSGENNDQPSQVGLTSAVIADPSPQQAPSVLGIPSDSAEPVTSSNHGDLNPTGLPSSAESSAHLSLLG